MGILKESIALVGTQARGENGSSMGRYAQRESLIGGLADVLLQGTATALNGPKSGQRGTPRSHHRAFEEHHSRTDDDGRPPSYRREDRFQRWRDPSYSHEEDIDYTQDHEPDYHSDYHRRDPVFDDDVDSFPYTAGPEDSKYPSQFDFLPAMEAREHRDPPPVPPRPTNSSVSRYPPFTPTYVVSIGKRGLDGGFPNAWPPCLDAHGRHPFDTHNINQADWTQFLGEIQRQGALSLGDQLGVKGLDHAANAVMSGGMAVRIVAKKALRAYRLNGVPAIIDQWNAQFFHPRQMEAIFTCGMARLDSGQCRLPNVDPRCEGGSVTSASLANMNRKQGKEYVGNDSAYRLFIVPKN